MLLKDGKELKYKMVLISGAVISLYLGDPSAEKLALLLILNDYKFSQLGSTGSNVRTHKRIRLLS